MRKIIHIDCDCFYAAVEMRDNPELVNKPLAIGGRSSRRGVLSTCNYVARQFGLHSAMPVHEALRLCPDVILMPARFDVYREVSQHVRDIFADYSDKIEPLSLDEAFIDVSDCTLHGGVATDIAKAICKRIEQEVGITASAGVAPNKFLAKVASDWQKPSGITVITPKRVEAFVAQLPVKKIPGVGPSAMKKMQQLNITYAGDLQQLPLPLLQQNFGVFGERLYQLCRGQDNREVKTERVRKSLSVETTFEYDLRLLDDLQKALQDLLEKLTARLAALKEPYVINSCQVKLKFSDFSQTTKSLVFGHVNADVFTSLLQQAFARSSLPVRLLGVGVSFKPIEPFTQLHLF